MPSATPPPPPATALRFLRAALKQQTDVLALVDCVLPELAEVAGHLVDAFSDGGHAYLFGNGGSASDAAHWAAELTGRFQAERPSLPAVTLPTNTAEITAIANDYGFPQVFARPLSGLIRPGDVAIGFSTSGQSENVLCGLRSAQAGGATTIGLAGSSAPRMDACCTVVVRIPSSITAHIQQAHAVCGHLVCGLVEQSLFPTAPAP